MGSESKKFGDVDIDYAGCKSLADAGRAELRYLEEVLGRILHRERKTLMGGGSGSRTGPRVSSFQLHK